MKGMQHYVFQPERAEWTGPVVRRDPVTYHGISVQLTWRCANVFCRHWTMNGAYLTGRCNFCFHPRG